MSTALRYARTAVLALAALVAIGVVGSGLYAYGQSVGRDQVAEVFDAGVSDAGPAFNVAAPNESKPAAVEVPKVEEPGALFEFSKKARKLGGLWLLIAVVLFAAAAEARKRSAPRPGEDVDPKSRRSRVYAISCGIAAVTATLVDVGFGGVGWSALVAPSAFAVARVWDAFDPPRGGKAKSETPAA